MAFLVYMITTFSLYVPDWSFVLHREDGTSERLTVCNPVKPSSATLNQTGSGLWILNYDYKWQNFNGLMPFLTLTLVLWLANCNALTELTMFNFSIIQKILGLGWEVCSISGEVWDERTFWACLQCCGICRQASLGRQSPLFPTSLDTLKGWFTSTWCFLCVWT